MLYKINQVSHETSVKQENEYFKAKGLCQKRVVEYGHFQYVLIRGIGDEEINGIP
jgi:hypothetical protein